MGKDTKTADAFANSWNNLPAGSVYTIEQVMDWLSPLKSSDLEGKSVLELGCGNASILTHVAQMSPKFVCGVDLGDSVYTATKNLQALSLNNFRVDKADLTTYLSNGYDVVYSIGVIHHLSNPYQGFQSVINNTKPGGRFHCWVYGWEGNLIVRLLVEPIRKVSCHLPWYISKYIIATPLAVILYTYSQIIKHIPALKRLGLPLTEYIVWIGRRGFKFHRHVIFDQIVTPSTVYIKKSEIEYWLNSSNKIDKSSVYIIQRNGNSWKFGGRIANG